MQAIDGVSCGDTYSDAAAVLDVFRANGGYFNISGADVFMQMQYGDYGASQFTDEVHVPQGNGILPAGVTGVRFRNYVAGAVATVSVGISSHGEPSFVIAASGAVTSSAAPTNVVNVKSPPHGATGNGVTDDTAAIQAAIAAAQAGGGGIVYFPVGNYLLTSSLQVPSFVTLQGVPLPFRASEYGIDPQTATSTLLLGGGKNFPLVTNSDHVVGNVSIGYENLRFQSNTGVGLANVPVVEFVRVRRSQMLDCYVIPNNNAGRVAVAISAASELLLLERCSLEGGGITIGASNSVTMRSLEIGAGGISIVGNLGVNGFDHEIVDCELYLTGVVAPYPWVSLIDLVDVSELIVANCNLSDALQHGILAHRGFVNSTITGCRVKNSSRQTANIWSGICIDVDTAAAHNSVDYQIVGNRCMDTQAVKTQAFGISLTNSGGGGLQNTRALVVANDVHDNLNAGVNDTTGGANVLANNIA